MVPLFLCSNVFFQSQIISGIIFTENQKKLSEVNIYIDGSKTHTVSDTAGNFSLDIQDQKTVTLVFHKKRYETSTVKISDVIGKKVKVILLRIQDMEEVVLIPYTDAAYQKYITYFLGQFVGFDQLNFIIKNQKSLKFSFDKKNQILKVKAPQTLIINNKKLAYLVKF